jgi:hypothetical protein
MCAVPWILCFLWHGFADGCFRPAWAGRAGTPSGRSWAPRTDDWSGHRDSLEYLCWYIETWVCPVVVEPSWVIVNCRHQQQHRTYTQWKGKRKKEKKSVNLISWHVYSLFRPYMTMYRCYVGLHIGYSIVFFLGFLFVIFWVMSRVRSSLLSRVNPR